MAVCFCYACGFCYVYDSALSPISRLIVQIKRQFSYSAPSSSFVHPISMIFALPFSTHHTIRLSSYAIPHDLPAPNLPASPCTTTPSSTPKQAAILYTTISLTHLFLSPLSYRNHDLLPHQSHIARHETLSFPHHLLPLPSPRYSLGTWLRIGVCTKITR